MGRLELLAALGAVEQLLVERGAEDARRDRVDQIRNDSVTSRIEARTITVEIALISGEMPA